GGMILDEGPVDLLGPRQLAQLEERKPEQIARALVARLVAERLLQREARIRGLTLMQRLRALGQRAVEFLVFGDVRIVFVEDAAVRCHGAGVHYFAGSLDASCDSCLSW